MGATRPEAATCHAPTRYGGSRLSPQAGYQDALHPLEITRHNIANWSDIELAAMNVAISNAKAGCLARKASDYTGPDLVSPVDQLPQIPAANTITALLLFPDWCASCLRLGQHLPETVFKVEGHSAYMYALLAETVPPRKPDPTITNAAFYPAYAAAMLSETPTVTVSPALLTRFPADNYPLLLLTDDRGILRVMQPVSAQDLQPGGDLDAAIALVGRNFSHTASAPSTPAASLPAKP